jgi:hypothetical protein
MGRVAEARRHRLQFAVAFDVNLVRTVDDDVVDGAVVEQGFERAETDDLVLHILDKLGALLQIEREAARHQNDGNGAGDFILEDGARNGLALHALLFEIFERQVEDAELDLLVAVGDADFADGAR